MSEPTGVDMTGVKEVIRALDDIHTELEKASRSLDRDYSGPTRGADQRIQLIREYSQAFARILYSFKARQEER